MDDAIKTIIDSKGDTRRVWQCPTCIRSDFRGMGTTWRISTKHPGTYQCPHCFARGK